MSTLTAAPTIAPARRSAPRRFAALVRAETTILLRNQTAVFTAVALPIIIAFAFANFSLDGISLGAMLTMVLVCTSLLFVVYYTLVASLVGRREQHTLEAAGVTVNVRVNILTLTLTIVAWALRTERLPPR